MNDSAISDDERYRATRNNTLVGAAVNAFLSTVSIFVGITQQSQALIADGMHSLSDLVGDVLVLFAAKHSQKKADIEHPYGHGRIETVASVILGAILVAVSIGIIYDALGRIQNPELLMQPTWVAFVVALVSIFAKEALYQYTIRFARKIKSPVVHANAWHHRSDALSSLIASAGILGAVAGIPILDAFAAMVVSVLIGRIGWQIAWNAVRELIDSSLDEDKVEKIRQAIYSVSGVKEIHSLRTRSHSGQALVDVHILIDDPKISVSEGHRIGETVYKKLVAELDFVSDVTVHVDAEDDETSAPSENLPLRDELLARLGEYWREIPIYNKIRRVTLHYINGNIHVELYLPLEVLNGKLQKDEIARNFRDTIAKCEPIARIDIFFE